MSLLLGWHMNGAVVCWNSETNEKRTFKVCSAWPEERHLDAALAELVRVVNPNDVRALVLAYDIVDSDTNKKVLDKIRAHGFRRATLVSWESMAFQNALQGADAVLAADEHVLFVLQQNCSGWRFCADRCVLVERLLWPWRANGSCPDVLKLFLTHHKVSKCFAVHALHSEAVRQEFPSCTVFDCSDTLSDESGAQTALSVAQFQDNGTRGEFLLAWDVYEA